MKGYTRPMLIYITRGFLSESQIKKMVNGIETFGYHGSTKIYLIPVECIEDVKAAIVALNEKWWDEGRFAHLQPAELANEPHSLKRKPKNAEYQGINE
ncbi:MAG: hypothetical protein M1542_08350 [Thermotogae bacterium]|jgi:hypothetical protein|nr:hypothetical protein [Thermotogota bacterium]MCL5033238.1 hypothetical protein [Thermotogota bacterium]